MPVTVLITGAGRGIGKAISLEIARYYSRINKPANMVICSRTMDELKVTEKELTLLGAHAKAIVCDISDEGAAQNMLYEARRCFGHIDILINNAGISHIGLFQDMDSKELTMLMNTNLLGMMRLSSMLIPDLLKSENSPRIINISSVWGNVGASCEVAYSAAKGGMNTFTKALARELAPSHIPVNAIACGYIDTEMNNHLTTEEKEELFDQIPAGRPGTAKEIGQMVCLLLEATDYLTGQIITVDGGWT